MKLKTYQAKSMSEALARVKRDLGAGAVILHTRTLRRGGVFGFGARSVVEITATADQKVLAMGGPARRRGTLPAEPAKASPRPRREAASESVQDRGAPVGAGTSASAAVVRDDPELRRELGAIRTMVHDLLKHTERSEHPEVPAELIEHYTRLVSRNVADDLAIELLRRVSEKLHISDKKPAADSVVSEAVEEELHKALCEMLPPAAPLKLKETDRPTVVAMVGPTGVGKTTTIAKLAANMKLRENKKVGLVTIDSYRIAAVEQLRTYAQILKVPLTPVMTPDEMREAIERMSDLDLVLIDTAGRSQRDELRIGELGELLAAAQPDEVHLVLSTTAGEQTLREAVSKFGKLGARRLIFTKLDEAVGFGVVLNVLKRVDMRLSYLTDGQSVPDDIAIASAGRVARLVLGRDERGTAVLETAGAEAACVKGGAA